MKSRLNTDTENNITKYIYVCMLHFVRSFRERCKIVTKGHKTSRDDFSVQKIFNYFN